MNRDSLPRIIQGGMGAGVSGWALARAVSMAGQLGVVSGTGLDTILARRLQLGDPGGHMRRALEHFPIPGVAGRILDRYFIKGGKAKGKRFTSKPVPAVKPGRRLLDLIVASNFAEVFLAKEGHDKPVGINYLEKIQLPTLPSLFGAMLAGAAWVLMGAGIPWRIPGAMDSLAAGELTQLKLDVRGAEKDEEFYTDFDPNAFCDGHAYQATRPGFLAIISSATLGTMLTRRATGRVDGFIVEGPTAGGHNAPPRGNRQLSGTGEPVYGQRDVPDLTAIRNLGLPFWLAGSYGSPERLAEAIELGAAGIQVGTAFAFCEESELDPLLKQRIIAMSGAGTTTVTTDPLASPTGFPFKVLQMEDDVSNAAVYRARCRVCDLGYLRYAYRKADGTLGWRCPAEPAEAYVRKGGDEKDTHGRKCVCNGLLANIGLAQIVAGDDIERPLITSGDDVAIVTRLLPPKATTYRATDVIKFLLGEPRGSVSGDARGTGDGSDGDATR